VLRHASLRAALFAITLLTLAVPQTASAQPAPTQFTIIDVPGAPGTGDSGINNRGQIVWGYNNSDVTNRYTFVYYHRVFHTLPNPPDVLASGPPVITDRCQIVGQQLNIDYTQHGFLYDKGVFTVIDHPDAPPPVGTYANGINNQGEIVGTYADSQSRAHGFMF